MEPLMMEPLAAGRNGAESPMALRSGEPGSVAAGPGNAKLHKAAEEFESMLLLSLWRSMKESFPGASEENKEPGSSTMEDLGLQAMTSAMAASGGLGLARMILRELEPDAGTEG